MTGDTLVALRSVHNKLATKRITLVKNKKNPEGKIDIKNFGDEILAPPFAHLGDHLPPDEAAHFGNEAPVVTGRRVSSSAV